MRRSILVLIVFSALVGLDRLAPARADLPAAASLPVRGQLSETTAHVGDTITLHVVTLAGASLTLRVVYPDASTLTAKGKAGHTGAWSHSWRVHTSEPGSAHAAVLVQLGKRHRSYTFPFRVVADPIATATLTATPTSTPTPTATATGTPTATPSATWTATPNPTATASATQVPAATSTPTATWTPSAVCVPKEGDNDNDDKGKPPGSNDKDGCP